MFSLSVSLLIRVRFQLISSCYQYVEVRYDLHQVLLLPIRFTRKIEEFCQASSTKNSLFFFRFLLVKSQNYIPRQRKNLDLRPFLWEVFYSSPNVYLCHQDYHSRSCHLCRPAQPVQCFLSLTDVSRRPQVVHSPPRGSLSPSILGILK